MTFRPVETSILDSLADLLRQGHVTKRVAG